LNNFYVLEYSGIDEHWNAGVFTDIENATKAVIEFCKENKKILNIIVYPVNTIFVYDIFDESEENMKRRIPGMDIIPFEILPQCAQQMCKNELRSRES
jgi:hypothetical protein